MSKTSKHEEFETQMAVREPDVGTQVAELHKQAQAQAAAMQEAGIETKDLEIPKLMLMQSTSDAVGEGKAKFGQIINTMDGSVVGGLDEGGVELIPLKQFKTVRIYDMGEKPPKFMRAEPDDGKNSAFENREGNENGVAIKRVLNMNFFVLLKKEVEADEAFPAVVSFKSTGIPAGKQLATQMFKMIQLNKMCYSKSVKLIVGKDKKDKNTYALFGIEKGETQSPETQLLAAKWLVSLAAANVKIVGGDDDSDEFVETSGSPVAAPTVVGGQEEAGLY